MSTERVDEKKATEKSMSEGRKRENKERNEHI